VAPGNGHEPGRVVTGSRNVWASECLQKTRGIQDSKRERSLGWAQASRQPPPRTPPRQSGKADPSPTATSEPCAVAPMPLWGAESASAETQPDARPQKRAALASAPCVPGEASSRSQRTSAVQVDKASRKQDEFWQAPVCHEDPYRQSVATTGSVVAIEGVALCRGISTIRGARVAMSLPPCAFAMCHTFASNRFHSGTEASHGNISLGYDHAFCFDVLENGRKGRRRRQATVLWVR